MNGIPVHSYLPTKATLGDTVHNITDGNTYFWSGSAWNKIIPQDGGISDGYIIHDTEKMVDYIDQLTEV